MYILSIIQTGYYRYFGYILCILSFAKSLSESNHRTRPSIHYNHGSPNFHNRTIGIPHGCIRDHRRFCSNVPLRSVEGLLCLLRTIGNISYTCSENLYLYLNTTESLIRKTQAFRSDTNVIENLKESESCQVISNKHRISLHREAVKFDVNGVLNSSQWFDDANAVHIIESSRSVLSEAEESFLKSYANHGWFVMNITLDDIFLAKLQHSIDDIFRHHSENLLAAKKTATIMTELTNFKAEPGTRLIDAHSLIPELAMLSLHPKIHRMVNLILQDQAVATQTLYFPYGSQQPLHRDPWYVVTTPVENMVACWIALEDISLDSGPLSFVSGSHKLSYHPLLNTGDIIFHSALATPGHFNFSKYSQFKF